MASEPSGSCRTERSQCSKLGLSDGIVRSEVDQVGGDDVGEEVATEGERPAALLRADGARDRLRRLLAVARLAGSRVDERDRERLDVVRRILVRDLPRPELPVRGLLQPFPCRTARRQPPQLGPGDPDPLGALGQRPMRWGSRRRPRLLAVEAARGFRRLASPQLQPDVSRTPTTSPDSATLLTRESVWPDRAEARAGPGSPGLTALGGRATIAGRLLGTSRSRWNPSRSHRGRANRTRASPGGHSPGSSTSSWSPCSSSSP